MSKGKIGIQVPFEKDIAPVVAFEIKNYKVNIVIYYY
jgi:hypothetical protein